MKLQGFIFDFNGTLLWDTRTSQYGLGYFSTQAWVYSLRRGEEPCDSWQDESRHSAGNFWRATL